MATREGFKLSRQERQRRIFSEDFKIKKVREIENRETSVSEVSRTYQVRSANVYKWIKKYGSGPKEGVRLIVEMESDTKKLIELQKRIAELERVVGQKQLMIDFQLKMIEIAEEMYGIDIKKKPESKPSSTSGSTENNSPLA